MHAARPGPGVLPTPHPAPPAALLEGQPIPGYRLLRRCGRGGFAEVWEAEAPGGFRVALKLVRLSSRDPSGELRAIEIVRGIRHPNLLAIFAAWQVDDFLVIGMELADGSLWDRFLEAAAQGGRGIPRAELLGYLDAAAAGIDFLNAYRHTVDGRTHLGVQHRDIKPQNLLLCGGGAKVADFGMVRAMEASLASHTGSWTLPYAAPEFFHGRTARQSDQYSLAATFGHLRGGRPPFGGTAAAITAGHMFGAPDLDALPEAERPIVARALAKAPEQRWPDCRAFIAALRAVAAAGVPDVLEGPDPDAGSAFFSEPFFLSSASPLGRPSDGAFAEPAGLMLETGPTDPFPRRPSRASWRRLRDLGAAVGVAAGLALAAAATARAPEGRPGAAPRPALETPGATATAGAAAALGTRSGPLRPAGFPPAAAPVLARRTAAPDPGKVAGPVEQGGPAAPSRAERALASPVADLAGPAARSEPPRTRPGAEWAVRVPSPEPMPGRDTGRAGWTRGEATGAAVAAVGGPAAGRAPELEGESLAAFERALASPPAAAATGRPEVAGITPVEAPVLPPRGGAATAAGTAFARGRSDLERGAYARAAAAFTEALRVEPGHPQAHFYRGMAYQLDRREREALADYTEALRRRPEDAHAHLYRGRVEHAQGLDERALADLGEAIRLRPGDAHAYLARGEVHHDLGAYDRAIADASEAVRLRPGDPSARYLRGLARYHSGDNLGAIADFSAVLRLDPKHGGALRARADALARTGQGARAGADRDALDRLTPARSRSRPRPSPTPRPGASPASPARTFRRGGGDLLRAEGPQSQPAAPQ